MRAAITSGLRHIFHRALIECRFARASIADNFSEKVGLMLSRHCEEQIVCRIVYITGPRDRCRHDNGQREYNAQRILPSQTFSLIIVIA